MILINDITGCEMIDDNSTAHLKGTPVWKSFNDRIRGIIETGESFVDYLELLFSLKLYSRYLYRYYTEWNTYHHLVRGAKASRENKNIIFLFFGSRDWYELFHKKCGYELYLNGQIFEKLAYQFSCTCGENHLAYIESQEHFVEFCKFAKISKYKFYNKNK